MEILVNFDYRESDLSNLRIAQLCEQVATGEGKPDSTEVSISFVDNETIKQLNNDYRGVDLATDVLSFECDGADDGFAPEGFEEDVYELGDIVIAPDVAEAQAKEYGSSFEDELYLLITHGMLHLCGYDHLLEDEAQAMEAKERFYLTQFLGRPFTR